MSARQKRKIRWLKELRATLTDDNYRLRARISTLSRELREARRNLPSGLCGHPNPTPVGSKIPCDQRIGHPGQHSSHDPLSHAWDYWDSALG